MNYYNEIKNELINNETYKKVKDYSKNKNDLKTYYNVGKLLSEAGKHYGEGIIKEYSPKLTKEFGKGYTYTALFRMRQFYSLSNIATLSQQLTWSHYIEILKLDDPNIINYYIKISETYNLSVRELRTKIKNKEYDRLDEETKNKLIFNNEDNNIKDFIKHPIIIKNKNNYEEISEKILKQLILEDIASFMKELGNGFCYIDSEYKIKLGERYN